MAKRNTADQHRMATWMTKRDQKKAIKTAKTPTYKRFLQEIQSFNADPIISKQSVEKQPKTTSGAGGKKAGDEVPKEAEVSAETDEEVEEDARVDDQDTDGTRVDVGPSEAVTDVRGVKGKRKRGRSARVTAKEDADWLEWQDTRMRRKHDDVVDKLDGLAITDDEEENESNAEPSGSNTEKESEEKDHGFDKDGDYEMEDAQQQPEQSMHDTAADTTTDPATQHPQPTKPPHPSPHTAATAARKRAKSRMRPMHLENPPSHAGSLVARAKSTRNSEWQELDKKNAKNREFWERQFDRPGWPLRERRGSSPV